MQNNTERKVNKNMAKWTATKGVFDKWHVVKGPRRLMTLKTVKARYAGKPITERVQRVRFFNSRAAAVKEAQRLNSGGNLRKGDS